MLKNVGANWVLTVATLLVTFALTPITIEMLGGEAYGTWTVVKSITGYLALLLVGIPMASVRFFAESIASGDRGRLGTAAGSCAATYVLMALAALAVGAGCFAYYVAVQEPEVEPSLRGAARLTYALTVLHVSIGFIGQLPYSLMAAHQHFLARNLIIMGGLVVRVILTVLVFLHYPSIVMLAAIQLAMLAFELVFAFAVARRLYPGVRIRFGDLSWPLIRKMLTFSSYALLLNVGLRIAFQTDAQVIGAMLGHEWAGCYDPPNQLVVYLTELVVGIAQVVMPLAATYAAQGRERELRAVVLRWSKISLSLALAVSCFLLVLGPEFLAWWTRQPHWKEPAGQVVRILVLSGIVFLPARGVLLPMLLGLGRVKAPAAVFFAASLINLGMSIALARPLGLAGVALGTAVPNVLFAFYVIWIGCRAVGERPAAFLAYVFPKALLGSLPVLGALVALREAMPGLVQELPGLLLAGMVSLAVFAAVWLLFVYRNDPHADLGVRARALGSRLLSRVKV